VQRERVADQEVGAGAARGYFYLFPMILLCLMVQLWLLDLLLFQSYSRDFTWG
jgi:hypothetical protein